MAEDAYLWAGYSVRLYKPSTSLVIQTIRVEVKMDNQNNSIVSTEAPASWTVRYDWNGYDCMLTLRGVNGSELLTRSQAALKWLTENGAQPLHYSNGKAAAAPKLENDENNPAWCTLHSVEMSKHTKNGHSWFSHQLENDEWCRGK